MRISDWSSDVCSSDLSVNGDDHPATAPSDTISGTNAGKLVATGRASSMVTAFLAASPSTAKLIAMRWSRWLAMVAPPDTLPPPLPSTTRPSRSEEHTSELQSLMRISYAVFCLKKKTQHIQ